MQTENRWLAIEDIAKATGICRRDLDTLRRHTRPGIRRRGAPDQTRRQLYDLADTLNWLHRVIGLNTAQRAGLHGRSRS